MAARKLTINELKTMDFSWMAPFIEWFFREIGIDLNDARIDPKDR